MSENLELKSVSEILDKNFYIPAYQRGYRWNSRQVEDLLSDILEFATNEEMKGFYCLQPVVVKKENVNSKDRYRVIDGQQRLTTLYIILKYLSEAREIIFPGDGGGLYSILYETRQEQESNSYEFLQKINSVTQRNTDNIDFYYMSNTFITIKEWFEFNKVNKGIFLNMLLENDFREIDGKNIDKAKNVRVIWYEIEDEDEIAVFTRLNIGKIPLTNAELIKALFVLNIEEQNEKIKLTTEWDNIEYTLQDSRFFAFLNDTDYDKATKIEFIFDLIADIKKNDLEIINLKKDDEKYSFYIFNVLISSDEQAKDIWKDVKKYFRIFNELYSSNIYYHLVGYLTNNGKSIKDIIKLFIENDKNTFKLKLDELIRQEILIKKDKSLKDLNYNDDRKKIYKILFLFNVISTIKSEYAKYPFDRHKIEKWSLEHIHAQNSEKIKKDKYKKALLESELLYVKDEQNKQRIQLMLDRYETENKIDSDEFNRLQEDIFRDEYYGDGVSVNSHTIDNLALLSRDDNSALNNSVFPAKRDKIIELDANGSFIPLGTKNVFLKYYSIDVKEAVQWNKEDMIAYLEAINRVLKDYLGASNE